MDTFDKLDRVDLQILRTLQENARLTTKELAARAGEIDRLCQRQYWRRGDR